MIIKNRLLIIFLLLALNSFGQEILMQNGTINSCSGVFLDSGGTTGAYSNNEDYVLTICPDSPGKKIELNFTEFNTQVNSDVVIIYNGDDITSPSLGVFSGSNSPGTISANNISNSSGCLTIRFFSSSTVNSTGWAANISCIMPCQTITSQLDSAIPAPNAEGFIRVCTNETITLTGSGNFEFDGTGATYE